MIDTPPKNGTAQVVEFPDAEEKVRRDQPTPILAEHAAAIRRLGKRVVADVIEIGRRLTECKPIIGHGYWLPWLKREFGWSADTAERFIQVSTLSDQIPQIAEFHIPLSGLYLLAAPSTPPKARAEIIERAETGEKISVKSVRRLLRPPEDMEEAGAPAASPRERPPYYFIERAEHVVRRAVGNAMPFLDPKDRGRLFKTLHSALSEIEKAERRFNPAVKAAKTRYRTKRQRPAG
jgi:hypothetical protein